AHEPAHEPAHRDLEPAHLETTRLESAPPARAHIGMELDSPAATASEVQREVRDFVRAHEQRRRHVPRAIVIGLLVGLVAVAFREALREAEHLRLALAALAHENWLWAPALPLLGACGAALAVYLV